MTRWRRTDRVLWRVVLDDAVLVMPDRGNEPFALAGGRRLWEALAEERGLGELAALVGAAGQSTDLTDLLESLASTGVVDRMTT